jgi:hypothetical protein
MAAQPMNKDSSFASRRPSELKYKKGTSSHESIGPHHPLTALLKSPFMYFWAIEM